MRAVRLAWARRDVGLGTGIVLLPLEKQDEQGATMLPSRCGRSPGPPCRKVRWCRLPVVVLPDSLVRMGLGLFWMEFFFFFLLNCMLFISAFLALAA